MTGIGWPLLLTATIRPKRVAYLAIVDAATRFRQYAYALTWWCRSRHVSSIVLVDNSLATDYTKRLEEIAVSENCALEVLSFRGSDRTTVLGKGFGDGECIDYALAHSKTLAAAPGFYKCTGRTAVTNLADLEQANIGRNNVFSLTGAHLPNPGGHLNTVFFRCEIAWFERHLRSAYHKCDDFKNAAMETVYFEAIHDVLTELSPVEPVVMGRRGALGTPYTGGDFPRVFRDEVDGRLGLPSEIPPPSIRIEKPDKYCGRYVAGDGSLGLEVAVWVEQGRLLARVHGAAFDWAGGSELIWKSEDCFHIVEFGESQVRFTMRSGRAATADFAIGTSLRIHFHRIG